jgi:hypothetical protein
MKANYEIYKRFCQLANINGVYLQSNLDEQEIIDWEKAINQLAYAE